MYRGVILTRKEHAAPQEPQHFSGEGCTLRDELENRSLECGCCDAVFQGVRDDVVAVQAVLNNYGLLVERPAEYARGWVDGSMSERAESGDEPQRGTRER